MIFAIQTKAARVTDNWGKFGYVSAKTEHGAIRAACQHASRMGVSFVAIQAVVCTYRQASFGRYVCMHCGHDESRHTRK